MIWHNFTFNRAKGDYNFIISDSTWSEYGTRKKFNKSDSPFFAVYNYNITHESSMWQRDKEPLMVDPNNLQVPPIFPDDSIVRHSLAVNYSNLIEMDKQVLLDFRLSRGDGIEFKRNFTKIRKVMDDMKKEQVKKGVPFN